MRQQRSSGMTLVWLVVVVGILPSGGSAKADFTFGEPVNLGPLVNSESKEGSPCVSADGLELYFMSLDRTAGLGDYDIWVARRESLSNDWEEPTNLGHIVNSWAQDGGPSISADDLELYFYSGRPGGLGRGDIWVTKRAAKEEPWGPPANLGAVVNTEDGESFPHISSDGLELYFASSRPGGSGEFNLWVTKRETKDGPWGEPVSLGPMVNSWSGQDTPRVSGDALLLVFSDHWSLPPRPGGLGNIDLWFSRRATRDGDWGEPVNLGSPVNTAFAEVDPMISADGSMLYFTSLRCGGSGNWDVWQAPIIPIADFNGDHRVDIEDLLTLIEYWDTDESLCDIGPMPWGDGVVDVQDLGVLMSYWEQEEAMTDRIELLAHWKLDEVEDMRAYDSAGNNHGTMIGDPIGQPTGGQIDGALQFDGVGDGVETDFVLDPGTGRAFSVFAWVKGGGPGQVIISQMNGQIWLMADAVGGNLKTQVFIIGGSPLSSQTHITDGQWHRVGLVYDGAYRILYVDDVEVARDAQAVCLSRGDGGLRIAAPNRLHFPGYWTGLIDDVRIYDRAVNP